jgi:hypothetical protein
MRLVGLAVAALLLGPAPLAAQPVPRPAVPVGALPTEDIAEIVQAMGLDPIGAPVRSGPFFVQRATDDFGRVLRVTVDARRSQVMAVEAAGLPRVPYGYGYGYRPYPGYAALPPHEALAPPGSAMTGPGGPPPHAQPQQVTPPPAATAPRPATKSAAVPPQRAPLPRKRPANAPEQAAAGTIEPVAQAPQPSPQSATAPAPAPTPAPAAPAKPEAPAMSPVAPLE